MHKNTSKKGFTLVEIMIVVVIIGLLAAMAIPAFKKVREDSKASAIKNDARQIAAAAQQYMLEYNLTQATLDYNSETGIIDSPLGVYVRKIGQDYTFSTTVLPRDVEANGTAFYVNHTSLNATKYPNGVPFSPEGQQVVSDID